jgi:hypothetical protein
LMLVLLKALRAATSATLSTASASGCLFIHWFVTRVRYFVQQGYRI